MKLLAKTILGLSAGLMLAAPQSASAAYPEKPIKVIINYGAGGNSDTSGYIVCLPKPVLGIYSANNIQ